MNSKQYFYDTWKKDMTENSSFLESLVRQSSLNPKGSIMGKKPTKEPVNYGYNLPWEVINEQIVPDKPELLKEDIQAHPNVSLALKLQQTSRKLANLKLEISRA